MGESVYRLLSGSQRTGPGWGRGEGGGGGRGGGEEREGREGGEGGKGGRGRAIRRLLGIKQTVLLWEDILYEMWYSSL